MANLFSTTGITAFSLIFVGWWIYFAVSVVACKILTWATRGNLMLFTGLIAFASALIVIMSDVRILQLRSDSVMSV